MLDAALLGLEINSTHMQCSSFEQLIDYIAISGWTGVVKVIVFLISNTIKNQILQCYLSFTQRTGKPQFLVPYEIPKRLSLNSKTGTYA